MILSGSSGQSDFREHSPSHLRHNPTVPPRKRSRQAFVMPRTHSACPSLNLHKSPDVSCLSPSSAIQTHLWNDIRVVDRKQVPPTHNDLAPRVRPIDVIASLLPHSAPSATTKMTWKSTSTSGTNSSKASSLFGLDEDDTTNILIYRYRSGSKALEVSSQQDLCKSLDDDPNLAFYRVTKKKIPRGNSRLEVRTEDLLPPEDLEKYAAKPTLKSSLANVGLPSRAYWKRLLFNSYPDLYIVSKSITPSPGSSLTGSPESSQHVSPTDVFNPNHDAAQAPPMS